VLAYELLAGHTPFEAVRAASRRAPGAAGPTTLVATARSKACSSSHASHGCAALSLDNVHTGI
jgi:hypothetical protein